MSENINIYRQYSSEISYITNAKEEDYLLPIGKEATTVEITSLGFDLLIETNLGVRAIPEKSSTTFSSAKENIKYVKVLKGSSKISLTAGMLDVTQKDAIEFSLSKWGK